MKTLLFLTLTLFLSKAFSIGQDRGNGGDAVVCRNSQGKITSAELLDIFKDSQLVLKFGIP